ncbi:MAG: mycothione reductase [Candidatus Tectomicrobia bacterium]|nr:mycothione reductase [Candidatus Tectomicrobia bacterium]
MNTEKYDLIIVGAGSGNMIPVAEMDSWRIAIVEPDKFGGTCLNRGCIPSKMLLYAAEVTEMARHGSRLGVRHTLERVDWQRLVGRVWEKIDPIAEAGAQYRRTQSNVTVYDAPAHFVGPYILETDGHRITADRIVLGAGARPVVPDIPGLQDITYHTSDSIMHLATQPFSLLIVGGGDIGAEMAHFFGSLGTRVTITDHGEALIKRQDDDIARAFTRIYERRFDVLLRTRVRSVNPENGHIVVQLEVNGRPRTIRVDTVLVASGRRPNSDRLNVAAAGIEVDARGRVMTDDGMETNVPGIFALGDLASRHPLKHIANAEARAIADHLVGGVKQPVEYDGVPNAVFGSPQVASVGLTERDALRQGLPHLTAYRQYADTAYGWAMEDNESFVKLIADPDSRLLLGAHIMGAHASLLIQPLVQGMKYGQTIDEMARTIYIHPALTEVVEQALLEFPRTLG